MRIAILYDRISDEAGPDQADSLIQANAVEDVLRDFGHLCRQFSFSLDVKSFMESLKEWKPDLVFNLLESVEGDGRLIHLAPSILDFSGIPYSGSSSEALYITSNKPLSKRLMAGAGIETPGSFTFPEASGRQCSLKGRYIIKSLWEHASVGIGEESVVSVGNTGQLAGEIQGSIDRLGSDCFAEQYIEGREFNISLIAGERGVIPLPAAEILFNGYPDEKVRIVCYKAKWDHGSFEYRHTNRTFDFPKEDESLLKKLEDISERCWNLFGLNGYARVDFRVDKENRPWVLEVNANPCLSPDAGFAAAAFKAGMDYKRVIDFILCDSFNHPVKDMRVNSI